MNRLFFVLLGIFCISFVFITISSCSQPSTELSAKYSERLIQRAGASSVQAIRQATHAYILVQKSHQKIVLTPQQWSRLQSALLDDRSYHFDLQKRCPFIPEYTLYVGNHSTEQSFGFSMSCAKMEFIGVLIDCDAIVKELKQIL